MEKRSRKRIKRAMTLMEIMVVILIIGTVISVLGYNIKGSFEKSKEFKTTQLIQKIKDILEMEVAEGNCTLEQIPGGWETILKQSSLLHSHVNYTKDGWGKPLVVSVDNGEINVTSEGLRAKHLDKTSKVATSSAQ